MMDRNYSTSTCIKKIDDSSNITLYVEWSDAKASNEGAAGTKKFDDSSKSFDTHHAGKHCLSYRDVTPTLTSHRRRRYVPHSSVIIAGLSVANAFREAHVACMRSQVALVKLLRKGSSDAK